MFVDSVLGLFPHRMD